MDYRARFLIDTGGVMLVALVVGLLSRLVDISPGLQIAALVAAAAIAIGDIMRAGDDRPLWRSRRLERRWPMPRAPEPR